MSHHAQYPELVRIRDLTQELTVGVASTIASVRTLSNVSFVLRAQELVVLTGNRGAGERALLAVIAGDRRGVTGTCVMNARVRVRLMRVGADAALAIAQEWARASLHAAPLTSFGMGARRGAAPRAQSAVAERTGGALHLSTQNNAYDNRTPEARELFLLDVVQGDAPSRSTHRPWNEKNRPAVHAWATTCRVRGGGVVIAAGQALGQGLLNHALMQFGTAVRNVVPRARIGYSYNRMPAPAPVRIVVMHCGCLAPDVPLDSPELLAVR